MLHVAEAGDDQLYALRLFIGNKKPRDTRIDLIKEHLILRNWKRSPMKAITVDHCVWVKLIDKDKNEAKSEAAKPAAALLDHCLEAGIQIYASSRIKNYDARAMTGAGDQDRLDALLEKYCVKEEPSGFRLGDANAPVLRGSMFGGSDVLSGPISDPDKVMAFRKLFGNDPASLPPENTGKKVHSWIADYDALLGHYCTGHDIFVTVDTKKPCFDPQSRIDAENELKILIRSPEDALALLQQ